MALRQSWFGLGCICLLFLISAGCGGENSKSDKGGDKQTAKKEEPEGHVHGDGPHGGVIFDWGGGAYHIEFTVDHAKKEAAVYILGSDAKSLEPVKADKLLLSIEEPRFQVDLMAQPMEGESDGLCSRFVGTHDDLATEREFSGVVSGVVDGTPYTGKFAE